MDLGFEDDIQVRKGIEYVERHGEEKGQDEKGDGRTLRGGVIVHGPTSVWVRISAVSLVPPKVPSWRGLVTSVSAPPGGKAGAVVVHQRAPL